MAPQRIVQMMTPSTGGGSAIPHRPACLSTCADVRGCGSGVVSGAGNQEAAAAPDAMLSIRFGPVPSFHNPASSSKAQPASQPASYSETHPSYALLASAPVSWVVYLEL